MLFGFAVKSIQITIEGMSCLNCAVQVQRALASVPTVNFVAVTIGAATVEHENASPEQLHLDDLIHRTERTIESVRRE